METMVSISNPLSSFPPLPVRTVTYSASTSSRTSSFSATPTSMMKKKLLFRPQQSPTNFLGFGFQSYSSRKSAITCGGVSEINESQFSDVVLKSDRPVLVEFVATWCGPCRLMSSVIEWAAQEYQEQLSVVKIDHDSNPQLIEEYKVYGLPALILFKNGKEVPGSRREGAIPKAKLKAYLDALLVSVSVP